MAPVLRIYLGIVAVALACTFIEQVFLQRFVSRGTTWGHTPGCQREIGFWNLGLLVVVLGVLWNDDAAGARRVLRALVVLMALFGTNHLAAYLSNREAWIHRVGTVSNYLGLVAAVPLLLWAQS